MSLFPETSKQYSAKKCTTVFLFVLADESTCKTSKHAKKLKQKQKRNERNKKREQGANNEQAQIPFD